MTQLRGVWLNQSIKSWPIHQLPAPLPHHLPYFCFFYGVIQEVENSKKVPTYDFGSNHS